MLKIPIQPAKLLSSRTHQVPGKLLVTELFFSVPLDHAKPEGERLRLFCRSAEKFDKPAAPKSNTKKEPDTLPWFVYITGGPGFGGPRPQDSPVAQDVIQKGYKFLSFDHRGMGQSNTVTSATLALKGSAQSQADYLTHFRADNAVRDLEAIRLTLTADHPDDQKQWSIMGQSYGGFVSLSYLSLHPEGLREVFTLGGLGPVSQRKPDETIRRLYRQVTDRNRKYLDKYSEDVERVDRIVRHLDEKKPLLPSGVPLSRARFLSIGISFGAHGGFDRVHDLVQRAANDLDVFGFLTRPTLADVEALSPAFDQHVIYALLHGSLYTQGESSEWVFDRVVAEGNAKKDEPIHFTGEQVFKSAFDDYVELQSLKEVAHILEHRSDWPDLYDLDQLSKNPVPVYAAVYTEDMYVDLGFSLETAGIVKGTKTYQTNMIYHDGVRSKTADVLKNLWALRDDTID
ncbi:hypothetical protein B0A52_03120 [Exophiala mesophila]|uniref:AB hydrolase-1 domain-containing protein n=1 Tax=Exophiala mesophila TaxID=212818 RepID=A0A438NCH6_EXOME|nr:hypothetical protein B0A52_03120 [Exophiala mesophila]